MPNKKKQRNGFYYFMKVQIEEQQRYGKQYTMQTIVPLAHPKWQKLSQDKKDYYNDLAKKKKQWEQESQEGKMDCTGQFIKEVIQEEKEKENIASMRTRNVKMRIQELGDVDAIIREKFYIINFNIFCMTEEGEFIPAELGLVEFSILNGVTKQYHVFIDPGPLPIGYAYSCIQHSEDTHKIPPKDFSFSSNNYMYIYKQLITFISTHGLKRLPIYCFTDEIEQTEAVLEWIRERALDRGPECFQVYDLAMLLLELRLFASQTSGAAFVDSHGLAKDILTRSTFDYVSNISCSWHEEQDVANHCSLGIVKRYCYLMSDHLCPAYKVKMIPQKHLPLRDDSDKISIVEMPIQMRPRPYSPKSRSQRRLYSSEDETTHTIITNVKSKFCEDKDMHLIPGAAPGVLTEIPLEQDDVNSQTYTGLPSANPQKSAVSIANIVRGQESNFELCNNDDFPSLGHATVPNIGDLCISRGRGRGILARPHVLKEPEKPQIPKFTGIGRAFPMKR